MNFLRGKVTGQHGTARVALGEHGLIAPAELAARAGQDVLVGIRAENIEATTSPLDGALPARAEVVEPLGSHLLVTALLGGQRLKLLTRTDFPVEPDDQIWLRPETGKLRWYDPASGKELGEP
jgi:multiple sugar transport system ATP-binding protein